MVIHTGTVIHPAMGMIWARTMAPLITIRTATTRPTTIGIPVSTTHTITGAIVGVGSMRRLTAVRWGVAGQIVWAWLLTIPAAALVADAQALLEREGYYRGQIDGVLGPETRHAIVRYQSDKGLEPSGNLTSETLRSLGLQERVARY